MRNKTDAGAPLPPLFGGRYDLLELLGSGGMADVFRAVDRRTDRPVAVKLFRPGIDLIDTQRRLRREVELLASLRHPGLVRVLDADVGDDAVNRHRAYIVMELVDGPTLGERVRREPLTPTQAAALGASLCSALAYVHERGIVHRDVKPANVLLPRSGDTDVVAPKLTDFGIAHVVDSTRLTTDGLTIGTANYLSPEQARGMRVSTASDVYSLGLVLLESITGEVVYPGHGVEAALARLHRPPAVPPDLPPRLRDLLVRMTARDPHARPTAALAGAELAQAAEPSLGTELFALDVASLEERTTLITAGQHRRLPVRRHGGVLGVGAAVVVVLALLGALGAYFGSGPTISGGAGGGPSPAAQTSSPTAASTPAATPASTPTAASSTRRAASPVALRSTSSPHRAISAVVRSPGKHKPPKPRKPKKR